MKKILYIALLSIILFTSCKKFLDVNPSTTSINPSKIKDFMEILNGDSLAIGDYFLLDLMSDDIRVGDAIRNQENVYSRSYSWNKQIWNAGDTDIIYSNAYSRILQMNVILSKIDNAPTNDTLNTIANRENVISQALINRAWYYLQLSNIYGPAYNKSSINTDLTVPLVLIPDASSKPARATVATMYSQITSDLLRAVENPYLGAQGTDIIHPGKASGFALLARTYLYEAKYDSALAYADSSLALVSTLKNYNDSYKQPTQLYDLKSNPEILLARASIDYAYYRQYGQTFNASPGLNSLLGSYDLRFNNFTFSRYTFTYSYNSSAATSPNTLFMDMSVSVPEVLLTKAECLARSGDAQTAGALLDELRQNRITSYGLTPRTYTTDNILGYVLDERRRELYYHGGMRLFDLKRYNLDANLQQTLYRLDDSYPQDTVATLVPNSPLYLMPFADNIISNNTNIVQNPRQ